jgi:hypothetical protein
MERAVKNSFRAKAFFDSLNKRVALDPGPVAVLDNPKDHGLAGASDRER